MDRDEIEAALLEAHASGNKAALSVLYARAADAEIDPEAQAFYLTQAYVFALDTGAPTAKVLHASLVALGREAP